MSRTKIAGQDIQLIRSDALPAGTMVLSPDLYDLIADDGAAAKKASADLTAHAANFAALVEKAKS